MPTERQTKIRSNKAMKKSLEFIAKTFVVLVFFDLLILFTSMAQIALENRTGEWNGFWAWQAKAVLSVLPR